MLEEEKEDFREAMRPVYISVASFGHFSLSLGDPCMMDVQYS